MNSSKNSNQDKSEYLPPRNSDASQLQNIPRKLINSYQDIPDSLLMALFRKPNDRMFITQLEQSIIRFINSENQTLSLNPMNSYYRFLSYQVAGYHDLRHTVSRSNDAGNIVLYKGSMTQKSIKAPLLRELQEKNFDIKSIENAKVTQSNIDNNGISADEKTVSVNKPVKKFKILKRDAQQSVLNSIGQPETVDKVEVTDNHVDLKNNDLAEQKEDLEKQRYLKEKQYEEAKLKIFNKEQSAFDGENHDELVEKETFISSDPTSEFWGPIEGERAIPRDDDTPQYYRQNVPKNGLNKTGKSMNNITSRSNIYQTVQYPQLNGNPCIPQLLNNMPGQQQQFLNHNGNMSPQYGYQYPVQMENPNFQPGYYPPQQYGHQYNYPTSTNGGSDSTTPSDHWSRDNSNK